MSKSSPPTSASAAALADEGSFISFRLHRGLTAKLSGPERRADFEQLLPEQQAEAWAVAMEQLERRRIVDELVTEPADPKPATPSRQPKPSRQPRRRIIGDPLLSVPPPEYVRAFCNLEVPLAGGSIRCPLTDHEDRSPSFKVWSGPERGVWCFGCHRGGDIYAFASTLWGLPARGLDFILLRRRIAVELLGRAAP